MKSNTQFQRANDVIQADKSVMSDGCKALVMKDFTDKFDEYFDVIGLPKMEITCRNGTYGICIEFQAERIKKFNVLK